MFSAVKKPQLGVLSILLRARGLDLNSRNAFGITALMEAASRGHLTVVRMLTGKPELLVRDTIVLLAHGWLVCTTSSTSHICV